MRILHISSLYPPGVVGGAEKIAALLAEAQAAQGHAVAAAFLTRDARPQGASGPVELHPVASRNLIWIEDVQHRPRPLRTLNKLWQAVNARAAADFGEVVARFRPDVVHTHSMVELPPMVWRAVRATGAKVVHTLHDYDLLCSRGTLFRNGRDCGPHRHAACRALSLWKTRFATDIDAVAAVSRPVLDRHLRFGVFTGLPAAHRRVIWNGVPTDASVPAAPVVRDDPAFVFGFLGRLVPEKGLNVLIDACRRLPSTGWRLEVAGKSPDGDAAFRMRAQGLPVTFRGFVEPAAFLRSLDVLLAPSIWGEPFGLSVVEAYRAGRPVMASDAGALGEIVGLVDPTWITPAGDAYALGRRMAEVLTAGRAALPRPPAFDTVLAAVRPEAMRDAYMDLYAQVLGAPREAARSAA